MKTIEFTEEEVRVLLRFLGRFPRNPEMFNAVYIPPAARLRQQADQMEQDDRDYPILQDAIKKLAQT